MLSVRNLQSAYGASQVLFDVGLDIGEGEVVTLLGRNGMGKTTTVRSMMGLLAPKGGEISFDGRALKGNTPEAIARCGIGLVPEGRQVFPDAHRAREPRRHRRQPARAFLALDAGAGLRPVPAPPGARRQSARTLSGGEQQMLAVGRALMTNPKLLILDEATEGLAPVIRAEIWRCIEALKAQGQSILLIDKTLSELLPVADRCVILENGRSAWHGTPAELSADLQDRYLGV
jgi:branched-chain amino acid transport system ATP-binding protein